MVSAEAFIPIEEKHGENCTCKPMGHIAIDLVAASRACPGDRNPHRAGSITAQLQEYEPTPYPGHGIVITWPASTGDNTPLFAWPMMVHDHTTGEPLLAVTGLRMALGGEDWDGGPIQVDIKTFVDSDGKPLIGAPAIPVRDPDDPERFYAKVFRCYVTEMRIRDAAVPTEESVARGEHSPNALRMHRGVGGHDGGSETRRS
jgi:hypothetical protein